MPKLVIPTAQEMRLFLQKNFSLFRKIENQEIIDDIEFNQLLRHEALLAQGFVLKNSLEVKEERNTLPKKTKVGFEDGYRFDLRFEVSKKVRGEEDVVISLLFWSTFVRFQDQVRKSDESRLLILDSRYRKPVYYSFPIHRTKNYFDTCLSWKDALMYKLANWPTCTKCGRPLPLVRKKYNGNPDNLHSYYHIKCPHCFPNPKRRFAATFYINMNPESVHSKFIASRHEKNYNQRMKKIDEGKEPVPQPFLKAQKKKKEEGIHYVKAYNDGEAPE